MLPLKMYSLEAKYLKSNMLVYFNSYIKDQQIVIDDFVQFRMELEAFPVLNT